ncbi:hypothetical protein, partial [Nonomuraea rhizosphaerae]|uniref:hypothetical protein n=1 Tax=Nonomuraea rhizosphaerae TaxID=2665663 RepID=UPI001C6051CC
MDMGAYMGVDGANDHGRAERLIAQGRAARERAEERRRDAETSWLRLQARQAEAHEQLERVRAAGKDAGAVGRFLLPSLDYADRSGVIVAGLRAALELTCGDKGNVQLLDRAAGGLTIAAHHGFDQPFLDFFAVVADDCSVCGRAMAGAEPVPGGGVG